MSIKIRTDQLSWNVKMKNILAIIILLSGINTASAYELPERFYNDLRIGSTIFLEEWSKYEKFHFGFNVYKEPDSQSFYLIKLYDGPIKILSYDKKEQILGITAHWIKIQFQGRDQDYQGYIWSGELINNIQLLASINTSFVIDIDDNNNMVLLAIDGVGKNEGQIIGKITETMDGKSMLLSQRIVSRADFSFALAVLEVTSSNSAYNFANYYFYYAWQDNQFVKLLSTTQEGIGECGEYLEDISSTTNGVVVKTIQFHPDNCHENTASQQSLFNTILYQWDDKQKKLIQQKQTSSLIQQPDNQ